VNKIRPQSGVTLTNLEIAFVFPDSFPVSSPSYSVQQHLIGTDFQPRFGIQLYRLDHNPVGVLRKRTLRFEASPHRHREMNHKVMAGSRIASMARSSTPATLQQALITQVT
jgi:hypothetical protein